MKFSFLLILILTMLIGTTGFGFHFAIQKPFPKAGIFTSEQLSHIFPVSENNPSLSEPSTKPRLKDQQRKILQHMAKNYLIICPKQMGCLVCQWSHTAFSSRRYLHYQKRKKELEDFLELLNKEDASLEQVVEALKLMKPFLGTYGQGFYAQCMLTLGYDENLENK